MLNTFVKNSPDPHPFSVLIVDDCEMNRSVLSRRMTRLGYQIEEADDGERALDLLDRRKFDLVLLDIVMPNVDGYQVLRKMKADAELACIPVIVITAKEELDDMAKCIKLGAEDCLPKPYPSVIFEARINSCLEKKRLSDQQNELKVKIEQQNLQLEQQVHSQVDKISQAQTSTIFALSKLAESRDPETGEHLERLRKYCETIAQNLAVKKKYADDITPFFINSMYIASPLHDIGKVGIPDKILLKPGPLDEQEWEIMKTHTTLGADTLRAVEQTVENNAFIRTGIEIAQSHHEKWDGSGYPQGLRGTEIPLSARILALGDVYDALRSKRPYKQPYSHEESVKIIESGRNRHFDPDIVDVFLMQENTFNGVWKKYKDKDSDPN